jgi:hydrogenase maturation factor HypF (carbamoyltransferase family)
MRAKIPTGARDEIPGDVANRYRADVARRQPWRMAAAYLDAIHGDSIPRDLEVMRRNARHWPLVVKLARAKINAPLTSSVGRLFDAVAPIIGIRDSINYERQAAIELSNLRFNPITLTTISTFRLRMRT